MKKVALTILIIFTTMIITIKYTYYKIDLEKNLKLITINELVKNVANSNEIKIYEWHYYLIDRNNNVSTYKTYGGFIYLGLELHQFHMTIKYKNYTDYSILYLSVDNK